MSSDSHINRVSTGLSNLDDILNGGLIDQRAYLVRGGPGTGKTILGLHFLEENMERGDGSLFITLAEPEKEVRRNAHQVGFEIEDLEVLDLSPNSNVFAEEGTYDIFDSSEVEHDPLVESIKDRLEEQDISWVFLDSITNFRLLTPDHYQFRRQMLSLMRFFKEKGITLLFTSEASSDQPDSDLQFLADGIITLDGEGANRKLTVNKFRGSGFDAGPHSISISKNGLEVYPDLKTPEDYDENLEKTVLSSGVPEVDELLNGGLEKTTLTLITGPSGVGKTSLGCQFMKEAAGRGERSAAFMFDESPASLIQRSESINIPVKQMLGRDTLDLHKVDPMKVNCDQFAEMVKEEVEEKGAQIVMIDSVNGYRLTLREEELAREIYSLTEYLKSKGVTTILTSEVSQVTGSFELTDMGVSFLTDNVVFLRNLELNGELRKAIGVFKKRISDFENTVREFEITENGIKVGEPLSGLKGILSGQPELTGGQNE